MPAEQSFAEREASFNAAMLKGDLGRAVQLARAARVAAKRKGLALPPWAQPLPRGRGGSAALQARAPKPSATVIQLRPGALELPAALQAWRRSSLSHAVQLHADGRVTLRRGSVYAGDATEALFPDVASAVAAVTPAIPWVRVAAVARRPFQ